MKTSVALGVFLVAACTQLAFGQLPHNPGHLVVSGRHPKRLKVTQAVPPILQLAIRAASSIHLKGDVTVQFRTKNGYQSVLQHYWQLGRKVRIEYPEGGPFGGQIIVDNGVHRYRYMPRQHIVREEVAHEDYVLLNALANRSRRPFGGVSVVENGGTIAGRQTELVSVVNKNLSVVQQLWIDRATGAILKREGFGPYGNLVAEYHFDTVQYNPAYPPDAFDINRFGARIVDAMTMLKNQSVKVGVPPMVLTDPGFQLVSSHIVNRLNQDILTSVYQGKSVRITIFEFRAHIDEGAFTKAERGRIHVVTREFPGATVVLFGALPENRLNDLANHLSRAE